MPTLEVLPAAHLHPQQLVVFTNLIVLCRSLEFPDPQFTSLAKGLAVQAFDLKDRDIDRTVAARESGVESMYYCRCLG